MHVQPEGPSHMTLSSMGILKNLSVFPHWIWLCPLFPIHASCDKHFHVPFICAFPNDWSFFPRPILYRYGACFSSWFDFFFRLYLFWSTVLKVVNLLLMFFYTPSWFTLNYECEYLAMVDWFHL